MTLEVLLSTMQMQAGDHRLLDKMNIGSDALIVNQTDQLEEGCRYEAYDFRGWKIRVYSFKEKGVGLSRNSALMRSRADICLFADDDVVYGEGYSDKIEAAFRDNPKADLMVFNLASDATERWEPLITKDSRVRFYNCMRYGCFRIAARVDRLKAKNIYFSLLFGGGTRYGSGEDTLFLVDCLRRGLRIYASPLEIGAVSHAESTWFEGYTEKFFLDKGALFYAISRPFSLFLCLQFALRRRKMFEASMGPMAAFKLMLKGRRA